MTSELPPPLSIDALRELFALFISTHAVIHEKELASALGFESHRQLAALRRKYGWRHLRFDRTHIAYDAWGVAEVVTVLNHQRGCLLFDAFTPAGSVYRRKSGDRMWTASVSIGSGPTRQRFTYTAKAEAEVRDMLRMLRASATVEIEVRRLIRECAPSATVARLLPKAEPAAKASPPSRGGLVSLSEFVAMRTMPFSKGQLRAWIRAGYVPAARESKAPNAKLWIRPEDVRAYVESWPDYDPSAGEPRAIRRDDNGRFTATS